MNTSPTLLPPPTLSLAQERLWVLEQLAPGNPTHHLSEAFRLTGALTASALQQSLTEIVRRHETLRTTFKAAGGQPRPVVCAPTPLNLAAIDLRDLPAPAREQEVRRLGLEQARRPFDLTGDLLLRATLARLEETEHVLLITLHRLAADRESLSILLRELGLLYESFLAREPSPLPALPRQYAEFAAQQRKWLESERAKKQLAFWKQRLEGMPHLFEFPMGHPRPAAPTGHAGRHRVTFDKSMTESLTALGQQEKCSLSTTLLAAFQALASRYTGRHDIVIGFAASHRASAESQAMMGNFANMLVLRTDLAGDPAFSEFMRRVQAVMTEAQAHAAFPFERLVEELRPPRAQSYHPLVQVRFTFQEEPWPLHQGATLAISRFEIDCQPAKADLGLSLAETSRGLEGWMEYATDLFDAETIRRMVGHLETILKGILENPSEHLSRLPLLTGAERQRLLLEWNETQADFPPGECVHQLFEAQVQRSPEAIALVFEREQLTYRELNRRANQLAHHLRQLGVGPEVLAGICAERSVELIVGILAVLKAGGAYVPLDPGYPAERLAFILQDTKAPVLLTQQNLSARLPGHQARIVLLDDPALWAEASQAGGEENPSPEVNPENLAYVIYTSGSTGQPKGVAIEHRSPVTFVHWAQEVFSPEELAGVLASTSICFDLSVFEIFVPLSAGGKIILAENALELPKLPAARQVTLINTVPSAITQLVRTGGLPPRVRTVNLAGEPLETALVRQIYQAGTVAKVYDLYGPSETTIYSTFALRKSEGPATIGRPISNTRVYLLDEQLQPVPVGVPGELYLGGGGLARGYLHQPTLTAEKFIQSPFDHQPAARLYKTGDLARYRPDGNIEFLGRKDHQVKIRGFRIELGEIETVLRQHPSVRAAAVIAREDVPGDKRLVAYVAGNAHSEDQNFVPELRAWLKGKLPEYMVPSLFVPLPALPLTPNGKTDRKALPPPEQVRPALKECFLGPRTATEEMLAEIWGEVLALDQVGVHDNFFELGGHSLMVIQAISRVRETVQVELSMRAFFETPTIAALAGTIEAILVAEIGELSEEEAQLLASGSPLSAAG